ncbi:MAG: winged helix-turn-helix transcriptional regulator [Rikenellaceae bacterium]
MAKYHLDEIDRKILGYLIENARMPFLEIARECGISGAAIHQRVRKLEDAGIIMGSRLLVNAKALGLDVCAYVGVQLSDPDMCESVIEQFKNIPEIVECHFITGRNTLLVKLFCTNNEHLMMILVNALQKIKGVSQTETFVSLDQPFAPREVSIPCNQ